MTLTVMTNNTSSLKKLALAVMKHIQLKQMSITRSKVRNWSNTPQIKTLTTMAATISSMTMDNTSNMISSGTHSNNTATISNMISRPMINSNTISRILEQKIVMRPKICLQS